MRGYKITCTASAYRDRELVATKGWSVAVAETDPLVAKLRSNPAFKFEPCEVPDAVPPATAAKPAAAGKEKPAEKTPEVPGDKKPEAPPMPPSEEDDIAKVPGIAPALIEGMKAKGYDTVAKVIAAGPDALDEIEGIGPPTANQILLACSEYLGE